MESSNHVSDIGLNVKPFEEWIEPGTKPAGDQTFSFQYSLRGALWTFCSPGRRSSAVATESGRRRSCSAKSPSLTTTSPVG